MRCKGYRPNIAGYFEEGHSKVIRCTREATHNVKMGPSAVDTINGKRPLCSLCARSYIGYKVSLIEEDSTAKITA